MLFSAIAAALGVVTLAANQLGTQLTFTDVTRQAGITFVHHNGAAGDKWYPELFGGGVAVLDIDGDRWPDLLFVNGRDWPATGRGARHGLYRNNRDGTFRDVLAGSGLDTANVYGLGAAVADYDNDGRDDFFLTTADGGRLFHNEGNGRFSDVTARAGIRNSDFTVSAAWLDYDRDGLVDLFIGNYVQWSPALEVRCALDGEQGYCGPDAYKPRAPKLYRNRGGGRFEDATERADPTIPRIRPWASRCSTTTGTAGRTCSSPATASPQSSIGTTGVATSWTRVCAPAWRSARAAPRAATWGPMRRTTIAPAVRTSSSGTS